MPDFMTPLHTTPVMASAHLVEDGTSYHVCYVVLSKKTHALKVVHLDDLKQQEKLPAYIASKRLGFIDNANGLHLHRQQCELLKAKNIEQIGYKGVAPHAQSTAITVADVATIEDDEYEALDASQLIAQVEQARNEMRQRLNGLTHYATDDFARAARALENIYENLTHRTIQRMLEKWAEQISLIDAQKKVERQEQRLKDVLISEIRLKKDLLKWDITRAITLEETLTVQNYQWACLHPHLPSGEALIVS